MLRGIIFHTCIVWMVYRQLVVCLSTCICGWWTEGHDEQKEEKICSFSFRRGPNVSTKCFAFTAEFPRICANSLAKKRTERHEPAVKWFLHPFGLRVVNASWQYEAHLPKPILSDLMRGHTHFQQLFFSCHLGIWFLDQTLGTEMMRSCQLKWHQFKGSPTE